MKRAPRRREPFDYEGVMLGISKARAARILLDATPDYFQIPITLRPGEDEQEIRGWIKDFAFEALDEALLEIEAEYRKIRAGENPSAVA